jgi:benzoyl-CoA reductase/2-hydroxyglutaryl-CoA dehydratase subunit BcrC/BadD/HgdB
MSTPWEIFNKQLEAALPALAERRAGEPGRPRLMLVGGGCDSADFVDFIESKGATVVADALCFGMRHFQGVVEEDAEEPRRAIAERYTNRFACPSIMNGFPHNYAILKGIIDEWHPDAVICARLKFCDHWGGHRKLLAEELRKEGLPLLDLEREYSTAGSGQISTRVQAFLEMLKT